MTVDLCLYCDATLPDDYYTQPVPYWTDDEGWAALAELHDPDCEWVASRSFRQWDA